MPARCHDLAQFGDLRRPRGSPQRQRRAAEKAAEAGRKMAVAVEPGIERDSREIVAAVEYGIQRLRQPFVQDVGIDRGSDHLAEGAAEVKRGEGRDLGKASEAPF